MVATPFGLASILEKAIGMKSPLVTGVTALLLAVSPSMASATPNDTPQAKAQLGDWGVDTGNMSKTVRAGDDFYRYVKAPVIGGFTGDQRFFLSWAQLWRNVMTEGETRRRILSDNHSPGEFRVNGIVRNVDAWYKAFNVKPGDKLYLPPEKRVRIW